MLALRDGEGNTISSGTHTLQRVNELFKPDVLSKKRKKENVVCSSAECHGISGIIRCFIFNMSRSW